MLENAKRLKKVPSYDVRPDSEILTDLKDYGTEMPKQLSADNFKVSHHTNFSLDLINFAVQTVITGFEKQKGGLWGI